MIRECRELNASKYIYFNGTDKVANEIYDFVNGEGGYDITTSIASNGVINTVLTCESSDGYLIRVYEGTYIIFENDGGIKYCNKSDFIEKYLDEDNYEFGKCVEFC